MNWSIALSLLLELWEFTFTAFFWSLLSVGDQSAQKVENMNSYNSTPMKETDNATH